MRIVSYESPRFDGPARGRLAAWLSSLFHRFFAAPVEQQLWAMMVPGFGCGEGVVAVGWRLVGPWDSDAYRWN